MEQDAFNDSVREIFTSEKIKSFLTVMSRFHSYSVKNTLMIEEQNPDATLVAGKKAWETKYGRTVNEGAEPIQIWAPVRGSKDEFQTVNVYDVSQTSGRDLSEALGNHSVKDKEKFFEALESVSSIPLKRDSDIEDNIKSAIYSIAQSSIKTNDKAAAALETECIAYAVSKHFGIDTENFSFSDVKEWAADKDASKLNSVLNEIRAASSKIISDISPKVSLEKSEEIAVSKEQPAPEKQLKDESTEIINLDAAKQTHTTNNDDLFYQIDDLGDKHTDDSFSQAVTLREENKRLEQELAKANSKIASLQKIVDTTNSVLKSNDTLLADFKAAMKKYDQKLGSTQKGINPEQPKKANPSKHGRK